MRPRILVFLLSFFLVLPFINKSKAQSFYRYNTNQWSASLSLGSATYFGDLKEDANLDLSPSIGIGVDYKLFSRVSIRSEVIWYQISGSDENANDPERRERNLSFRANNFEWNVQGVFHVFKEPMGFVKRIADIKPYNFYGFLGVGVTTVNPKAELNGVWYQLRGLQTEGVDYNPIAIVVPFGGGAKIKPNQDWALALEVSYHLVFSDYFDDVSDTYPDPTSLTDPLGISLSDRAPELGYAPRAPGTQRGNPSNDDGYLIINFRVEYLALSKLFGGNSRGVYKGPRKYKGARYR